MSRLESLSREEEEIPNIIKMVINLSRRRRRPCSTGRITRAGPAARRSERYIMVTYIGRAARRLLCTPTL